MFLFAFGVWIVRWVVAVLELEVKEGEGRRVNRRELDEEDYCEELERRQFEAS